MSDIREAIEEAFSGDDFEEPKSEVVEPVQEELELAPEEATESDQESDVSASDDTGAGSEPEPEPEGLEPTAEQSTGDAAPDAAEPDTKPPLGWAADAREEWGKVPSAVREQIAKREKEIEQAVAHTAEAKRAYAELDKMANTYGSVMAAEGARNPLEAINGLMQTVSQLRLGSPAQKAQKMAALIDHYGVDISMLDSALAGSEPQPAEHQQFEQLLDQKMAPVNEMMSNLASMQQNAQTQQAESVQSEVESFAKSAEFINDVRNDMADLLDLAQKRGQQMSLKDAYDKACLIHPTVSKVMKAREAESAMKKRQASSSIVGASPGAAPNSADKGIADTIRELWPE